MHQTFGGRRVELFYARVGFGRRRQHRQCLVGTHQHADHFSGVFAARQTRQSEQVAYALDYMKQCANNPDGGVYPVGTVIQLVPQEAMVKRAAGFDPATNDWEFFSLDVSGAERVGALIEYDDTTTIFTHPRDSRTRDYVTGRFG